MGALQWARHLEACDMRLQHSGRVSASRVRAKELNHNSNTDIDVVHFICSNRKATGVPSLGLLTNELMLTENTINFCSHF